jgi:hypothetical protein
MIQSLAQILLDSHNDGTRFEGANLKEMLRTLQEISKKDKLIPQEIRGKLENQFFYGEEANLIPILNSLRTHNQVFIMGGWSSATGGHAIYIGLTKTGPTSHTLTLYNRGAGIKAAHQTISWESKTLTNPVVQFSNIELDDAKLQEFLMKLFAPVSPNFESPGINTSNSEMPGIYYLYILQIVTLYSPNSPQLIHPKQAMVSSQRSGSCSWKSFTPVIKDLMSLGPKELKRLITCFKIGALELLYEETAQSHIAARLYDEALTSVCKRFKKTEFPDLVPALEDLIAKPRSTPEFKPQEMESASSPGRYLFLRDRSELKPGKILHRFPTLKETLQFNPSSFYARFQALKWCLYTLHSISTAQNWFDKLIEAGNSSPLGHNEYSLISKLSSESSASDKSQLETLEQRTLAYVMYFLKIFSFSKTYKDRCANRDDFNEFLRLIFTKTPKPDLPDDLPFVSAFHPIMTAILTEIDKILKKFPKRDISSAIFITGYENEAKKVNTYEGLKQIAVYKKLNEERWSTDTRARKDEIQAINKPLIDINREIVSSLISIGLDTGSMPLEFWFEVAKNVPPLIETSHVWKDPPLGETKVKDLNQALAIISGDYQSHFEQKSAQALRAAVTTDEHSSIAHRLARLISHDPCLEYPESWNGYADNPTDLFARQHYIWAKLLLDKTLIQLNEDDIKRLVIHLETKFHESLQKERISNTYYLMHGIALLLKYIPFEIGALSSLNFSPSGSEIGHQPYPFITEAAERMLTATTKILTKQCANSDFTAMATLLASSLCINQPNNPSVFFNFLTCLIAYNHPRLKILNKNSYLDQSTAAFIHAQVFDCWDILFKKPAFDPAQQVCVEEINRLSMQLNPEFTNLKFISLERQGGCQFTYNYKEKSSALAIYEKGDVVTDDPIVISFLPESLCSNETFKQLFPDTHKISEFAIQGGNVCFKYCNLQFHAMMNSFAQSYFLSFEGKYYEYSRHSFPLYFKDMSYWAGKEQSVLIHFSQDAATYEMYTHNSKHELVSPKNTKLFATKESIFSRITKNRHILIEESPAESGLSTKVHLSHFNLSFEIKITDSQHSFESINYPNYKVAATHAEIDRYFQTKTSFKAYLVLIHQGKPPLLIIPRYCYKSQKIFAQRFAEVVPDFDSLDWSKAQDPRYFVYSWDQEKQKLEHTDPNAIWQLICTMTVFDDIGHGIDEAFDYLQQQATSAPIDSTTEKTLEFILKDLATNTPEILALRAHILKLQPSLQAAAEHQAKLKNQLPNINFNYQPIAPSLEDSAQKTYTPTIIGKTIEKKTEYYCTYPPHEWIRFKKENIPFASDYADEAQIIRSFGIRFDDIRYRNPESVILFKLLKKTQTSNEVSWKISPPFFSTNTLSIQPSVSFWKSLPAPIAKTPRLKLTSSKFDPKISIQTLDQIKIEHSFLEFSPNSTHHKSLLDAISQGIVEAEKEEKHYKKESSKFKESFSAHEMTIATLSSIQTARTILEDIQKNIHQAFLAMHGPISYFARVHQTDENFNLFLKTFAKIPDLAQEDLWCEPDAYENFMLMAKTWLWTQTHIQHHQRLLKVTQEPELLFKELILNRQYDFDHPFAYLILLMEYQENVRLRPSQIQMINQLCTLENGEFPDRIIEAIMGDGKTFVAPIVAVARARALPEKLSILQLPMSIFKQQQSGVNQQMKKILGFEPGVFIYSREMRIQSWKSILDQFQTLKNSGIPLITTAETIACLHLSYLDNQTDDPSLKAIIQLIRNESAICTDEFDSVFDKTPVIYSIGDQGSLVDLNPKTTETLHIMLRILMEVMLENDRGLNKISENDYNEKILPRIMALINDKKSLNPEKYPPHTAVIPKFKSAYQHSVRDVSEFMKSPKLTIKEIENLFRDQKNQSAMLDLKLVHYLIHTIFPQVLIMPAGLVYGRSQNNISSHVVVPYRNGKECIGSRYNNPYITLTLTMIQSFRDGITQHQLQALIVRLLPEYQQQFTACSSSSLKICGKLGKIFDRASFPDFYDGLHQLDIDSPLLEQKVEKLYQSLIKDLSSIEFYKAQEAIALHTILPGVYYNKTKIKHPWASAPKNAGFSGTTHNMALFPFHQAPSSKIIDGRTLLKLKRCHPKFYPESFLSDSSWLETYLTEKPLTRAIIDAGSLLSIKDMHDYVKSNINMICDKTGCSVVLYFQESGFFALNQNHSTPISLNSFNRSDIDNCLQVPFDQRFVFFSPAYCRGSDLLLMNNANGLVMIRKDCQLSDTLQAIMRLRQFGSQTVDLLLENELMALISTSQKDTITVDSWWQKTCQLDQSRLQEQIVSYTNDYIISLFHDLIWKKIQNPKLPKSTKNAFLTKSPDLLERIQLCYESADPTQAFKALIADLSQFYQQQYKAIITPDEITTTTQKANALLQMMQPHLPEFIRLINKKTTHEDAKETVQEQEQVKQQAHEQQREAEKSCKITHPAMKIGGKLDPISISELLPSFPKQMMVSKNYREVSKASFAKQTLYPVLYVLKTSNQWIIISEADKNLYDRHALTMSRDIADKNKQILDMLLLQQDDHQLASLNDQELDYYIYTLMLSGHFEQLKKYLSDKDSPLSIKIVNIQFNSHHSQLFKELKIIAPNQQRQIENLDKTDMNRSIQQLKKLFNNARTQFYHAHRMEQTYGKKFRDIIRNKIYARSTHPRTPPVQKNQLIESIDKTQSQKTWQFLSTLLVLSLIFTAVYFSSIFWLKLSVLASTLQMLQHMFAENQHKKQMMSKTPLSFYMFMNPLGFMQTNVPEQAHNSLAFRCIKITNGIKTTLIYLMPLLLTLALFNAQLSAILLIPIILQGLLLGVKSTLMTHAFKKWFPDVKPYKSENQPTALYTLIDQSDPKKRTQEQRTIIAPLILDGRISSIPKLSQYPNKKERLKVALAILEYANNHLISISGIPDDYFSELLFHARALDTESHLYILNLLKAHALKEVKTPPTQNKSTLNDLMIKYSPSRRKLAQSAGHSLSRLSILSSTELAGKLHIKPSSDSAQKTMWLKKINEASPGKIQSWLEQIQKTLGPKNELHQDDTKHILQELFEHEVSIGQDKIPSFACALIIEKSRNPAVFPESASPARSKIPSIYAYIDTRKRLILSDTPSAQTQYHFDHSTHASVTELVRYISEQNINNMSQELFEELLQFLKEPSKLDKNAMTALKLKFTFPAEKSDLSPDSIQEISKRFEVVNHLSKIEIIFQNHSKTILSTNLPKKIQEMYGTMSCQLIF